MWHRGKVNCVVLVYLKKFLSGRGGHVYSQKGGKLFSVRAGGYELSLGGKLSTCEILGNYSYTQTFHY